MFYTRKGDTGTTKFLDTKSGARVSKNSCTTEVLGFLDELNSFLGLCKVKSERSGVVVGNKKISVSDVLENVQQNLFIVQAEVAGDKEKKIIQKKITEMEQAIDSIEIEIPKIISFTVVGGSELSALLDVARTIARRTERSLIGACESGEREVSDSTRTYLNRLSSLLFALARFVNFKSGIKEKSPHYQ